MHGFSILVQLLLLCPYFFASVELAFVTTLCLQCLTPPMQRMATLLTFKALSRLYYNLSKWLHVCECCAHA